MHKISPHNAGNEEFNFQNFPCGEEHGPPKNTRAIGARRAD